MARPAGRFTYDGELRRFRNAAGQLIPDNVILPTAVGLTGGADDAMELRHVGAGIGPGADGSLEHVAGASTPEWLREMRKGLKQPCRTCGEHVGLSDVILSGEHTRDWEKSQ